MGITRGQKRAIEEMAERLLKSAKAHSELPIDAEKVAKSVGLKVEYFPFPDEISGLLKKEVGVIGINENQSERRQRFTLAHEIGHYVLEHKMMSNDDMVDDSRTDTSLPAEREANYFASALLMPSDAVRKNAKGKFDIGSLANTFQVSEQAMTIRILELGLLK